MPTLQEVSDDTPPSEQPAAVKAIKDSDEFDEDELEVRASQKFTAIVITIHNQGGSRSSSTGICVSYVYIRMYTCGTG